MSKFSSSKRIQNGIATYEENSDRRIANDMYYVVHIEVSDSDVDVVDEVKSWLKARKEHQALVGYVYRNEIYLLFSSVEDGDHYLRGSHQGICSEYASLAALAFKCKVDVRIVELESRTVILVYFQTKVFENAKRSALSLSKGKLSKKEIGQLTFGEIVSTLQDKAGVIWDKIPSGTRFGSFYKYGSGTNQKERYLTISEMIDIQDREKYNSYLFG